MFKGKVILITGNGSFATACVERLLKEEVKEIRIFSRNEKMQVDNKRKFNDNRLNFILGDIRDYTAINETCKGIDYCIHSAALKHIDKCEKQPWESIKTNIIGSKNVMFACINNKVKKLICLSTDKATNAETQYGSAKFQMECLAKGIDNKDTEIILTRYGNVIGSSGSVIPYFKKLASENKPLTITSCSISRFFMKIEESVDLVLYALEHGKHKDLWVAKNKSATVGEIANIISKNQVIIGTRGVEKTGEAMLTATELNHSEEIGNYYRVNDNITSKIYYDEPFTSDNAERFTESELKNFIYPKKESFFMECEQKYSEYTRG